MNSTMVLVKINPKLIVRLWWRNDRMIHAMLSLWWNTKKKKKPTVYKWITYLWVIVFNAWGFFFLSFILFERQWDKKDILVHSPKASTAKTRRGQSYKSSTCPGLPPGRQRSRLWVILCFLQQCTLVRNNERWKCKGLNQTLLHGYG